MGSDLIIGLRISALGLAITFLAMGLVILAMILLLRIFPVRKVAQENQARTEPVASKVADEQALEELAVALAVGICLLEQESALMGRTEPGFRDPSLGKLLEG